MIKNLVSVIIPCFNVEKWLDDLFASLKAQTYKNFEAIFVNDGSTDGTKQKLEAFCSQNSNCTLINQQNAGPSAARNCGLGKAQGEFVYFCDADDLISPHLLEECVCQIGDFDCLAFKSFWVKESFSYEKMLKKSAKFLKKAKKLQKIALKTQKNGIKTQKIFKIAQEVEQNTENALNIENSQRIEKQETKNHNQKYFQVLDTPDDIISHLFSGRIDFGPCNKLYRLDKIQTLSTFPKAFDEKIFYGEDLEFNTRYLCNCTKIAAIKETLYFYRKRKGSAVRSGFNQKKLSVFNGLERALKLDDKIFANSKIYIKSQCAISCLEMLLKIIGTHFDDGATVEKLFLGLKNNAGFVKKGKLNKWYLRLFVPWMPFLTKPFVMKKLRSCKKQQKQENRKKLTTTNLK